jgi:phosphate starvation-inducible PhoH-like protein
MARNIAKSKEKGRRVTRSPRGLTPLTDKMEDMGRDFVKKVVKPLQALTEAQSDYINSIKVNKLTFGVGPAGTGKSYVATTMAADALIAGDIEKIIITRPIVEAGENLGFLPGEIGEKCAPYFAPIRYILEKRLGRGVVEMFEKNKRIEFIPLAYLRGHTLDDAFVILDEAQNTTPTQMKLFLTRLGENCSVVVDGDLRQIDIKGPSGLEDAIRRLGRLKEVGLVKFERSDICRSGLVQKIVERYENNHEHDDDPMQGILAFLENSC